MWVKTGWRRNSQRSTDLTDETDEKILMHPFYPFHPLTEFLLTMLLIGITGGIACGKTEVCKAFQKKGAIILSGDEIGKEVVEKNRKVLKELIKTFGKEIVNRNQSLNRRKLGEIAFASKKSKDLLNRMIHPYLLRELRKKINHLRRKRDKDVVVIDAALIVEWGLQKELDYLIFVESKREDKIKRLQKQKSYSRKEAIDRIKSQLPEITKKRLADFVIKNDKGLKELKKKAENIWEKIVSDWSVKL
jgi:dephospho-CoA kinase